MKSRSLLRCLSVGLLLGISLLGIAESAIAFYPRLAAHTTTWNHDDTTCIVCLLLLGYSLYLWEQP